MRDAGELLHPVVVQTSVNTTAATDAADVDDGGASRCDVIGTHPEHLLPSSMGSCTATMFVF